MYTHNEGLEKEELKIIVQCKNISSNGEQYYMALIKNIYCYKHYKHNKKHIPN